ncbi:nucleotide exchange factor GrpE [Paenibacillus sp. FA6]|uniref:nucleotide exchange factor GrpE n=1 Tax=Paenibacillus sp. FA6 TaxID=3413029 RepID=UPI003F657897
MKEEQQEINNVSEEIETDIVEEVNQQQSTSSLEQEPALLTELERLQALADENQQRVLRAQADFDNYRKRTQKEKEDSAKYASIRLITELLPIMDNFERAFSVDVANEQVESFSKGMDMIFRQLESTLQAEGLVAMESVGQPFNPEFHQAIMKVESDLYPEGTVVEEVQKGYMLKDKLLRPAMVKVSE